MASIPLLDLRLSPYDQSIFYYYMFLSLAHYSDGNYEEAVRWGRMAANENPVYTATCRVLAASLAASDQLEGRATWQQRC
jgi:adenylate cyclase